MVPRGQAWGTVGQHMVGLGLGQAKSEMLGLVALCTALVLRP
jgi:hypothetical protein